MDQIYYCTLLIAFFRYNSNSIHFIHLKSTGQWLLAYPQSCVSLITVRSGALSLSQKEIPHFSALTAPPALFL